ARPAHPTGPAMRQDAMGARPVFAPPTTHAGEEGVTTEAHTRLSPNFPDLLTLIAPRHPNRGPSIAEMAAGAGLSATLRSRGELPTRATQIYVVDTVGELGLVYRLASAVFIGGSLVRPGGQQPVAGPRVP